MISTRARSSSITRPRRVPSSAPAGEERWASFETHCAAPSAVRPTLHTRHARASLTARPRLLVSLSMLVRMPGCYAFMLCVALQSCGFFESGEPRVLAHRAAPGHWPENSRTAVINSIARGYPGIEVDIVLTADRVPVLAHEPWVNEELCRRGDGSEIGERVLIRDLSLEELHTGFRCGGIRDEEHPDAELVEDTHMTLDELIDALRDAPAVELYLDTKYDPELTLDADDFAREILDRWSDAGLPNQLYVESTWAQGTRALEEHGEVNSVLGWPRFPAGESEAAIAVGADLLGALGLAHALDEVEAARADGLSMPFQLVDWQVARQARDQGIPVFIWTMNRRGTLERYCDQPVDYIMTDYPERAPCL